MSHPCTIVEVNAPIGVGNAANGVRTVEEDGKPFRSRFRFLAYDGESGTSVITCCPLTG